MDYYQGGTGVQGRADNAFYSCKITVCMLLLLTSPGMEFTACTGAQGGPGHIVWQAGIVLSRYFVSHPGECCCKSFVHPVPHMHTMQSGRSCMGLKQI